MFHNSNLRSNAMAFPAQCAASTANTLLGGIFKPVRNRLKILGTALAMASASLTASGQTIDPVFNVGTGFVNPSSSINGNANK